MKKFFHLFLFVVFTSPLHLALSQSKQQKMAKPTLSAEPFEKLMKEWDMKLIEIKKVKEPDGVFILAEQVVNANPDFLLVIAEDLAVVLKDVPRSENFLKKQWDGLPLLKKKKLSSSLGESLWDMSQRLKTKGNG